MSKRLLLSTVSALLLVFGFSNAFAQGATGGVNGRVVDEAGNAVAGVTITLESKRTGKARAVTSNNAGAFRVQLPPGDYELTSSAAGFASVTVESVMVNLGTTANLTIPLKQAEMEEIVTYGSARQLMPASTGTTGINITLEELSRLPVARSIESVALLAPGTVPGDSAFGDDKRLVSFGGASVAENVYYINGMNVTNFRNGLGGASVPFEFYDQFQIKTGGYGAEFGRSTGGVLNAVTKKGSNEWEYGIVAFYEPTWFQGKSPNTIQANGGIYDINDQNERTGFTTDVYVGGPILKDRLFFYALYEFSDRQSDFNSLGSPDQWNEQKRDDPFWGGNLTWNVTDNHSLSFTTFTDEREIFTRQFDYDVDTRTKGAEVGTASTFRGGDNNIFSYEGQFGDNFSVSALYGENQYTLTSGGSSDFDCPLVVDVRAGAPTSRPGCEVNVTAESGRDEREAYRLDVKWLLGNHQIRAGFDREDNFSEGALGYSGLNLTDLPAGIYYRYERRAVGAELPNGAILPDLNGDGSDVETVRIRYFQNGGSFDTIQQAWYIEDQWNINEEFTLSVGIRNEYFENKNNEGATFIKVDDQWAPRIGFEWSPGGSRNQTIGLNWGRYHLPIATNTNVRLAGPEIDYQEYYYHDGLVDAGTYAPTTRNTTTGIPTTTQIGDRLLNSDGSIPDPLAVVDQNLEPMFQDEWILSYETELNENWVVGLRYVRRELSSTIDDVQADFGLEAMGFEGPLGGAQDCHYFLTNPGQDADVYCNEYIDPNDTSLGTQLVPITISAEDLGFPEAERTYDAFEIEINGQLDRWTIDGSYTWSKNKGNTEGYVKSDIGQDDAGITQDFDIPQLMDGANGYLPNDRRHKLRLFGAYQFSDRLSVGATLFLTSGRPINAFGEGHPDGTPAYGDTFYLTTDVGDPDVEGDETFQFVPRGTAGRTDWITQLNLNAIYTFNWGDRADIELRADIFNLLDAGGAQEVYEFAEIRSDRWRLPSVYQRPRYLRLGAAIRF